MHHTFRSHCVISRPSTHRSVVLAAQHCLWLLQLFEQCMLLHHLLLSWHWIWINFARCEMSHFVEDCHGSARWDWDFLWYVCLFHHLLRRFESFVNSALALRGELLRCLIEVFFLLLIFCRNISIICNFISFLLLANVCRWWDRKLVWKEAEQIAWLQSIIFWVHKIG